MTEKDRDKEAEDDISCMFKRVHFEEKSKSFYIILIQSINYLEDVSGSKN